MATHEKAGTNSSLVWTDKPIAVADVSWLHAAPGLHAELVCRVSAEPTPRLQWFVNGEEIDIIGSTRIMPYIQGQKHILQFRNITADDFGTYSCRATNSEGMSEATVELSGKLLCTFLTYTGAKSGIREIVRKTSRKFTKKMRMSRNCKKNKWKCHSNKLEHCQRNTGCPGIPKNTNLNGRKVSETN